MNPNVVAPRLSTAAPDSRGSSGLPEDVLSEQARIFLCRMGLEFDFVKVLDFGLVQTRQAGAATAVTETLVTAQQLIGTPAYMTPEVILGKDDVDRRADVYAIGWSNGHARVWWEARLPELAGPLLPH